MVVKRTITDMLYLSNLPHAVVALLFVVMVTLAVDVLTFGVVVIVVALVDVIGA